MVGRLARYLRFVGCDTVYVRGLSDPDVAARATADGRRLLTRDRDLAARCPGAVLLSSPALAVQWREVRAALPDVPTEVVFERCTVCNGRLLPQDPAAVHPRATGVPWDRVDRGLALFVCAECGHLYWDGSHTARMRRQLAEWAGETTP